MPDRTEHSAAPSPRGPWPEATDDRVFDHGAPWCVNAAGHPGPDDDYPDQHRHVPAGECRTRALFIDAFDALAGPGRDLEIYVARPFRFGESREAARPTDARVVFATIDQVTDAERRVSISRGDALRLALHLIAAVRLVDDAGR